MGTELYILNQAGEPVPCESIEEWGRWMQDANRHIGKDRVGEVLVSTVFLGLHHSFRETERILWETMIFGGKHDQYQKRYSSREDALKGHLEALAMVKDAP